MATEIKKVKEANNLPAYTTIENMIDLLEVYKKKSNDEKVTQEAFGKKGSAYTSTRSALRSFGLIEQDSCAFTYLGRFIAYSQDDEKKEHLGGAIMNFSPYETLLTNLFKNRTPSETPITEIVNFWGKFDRGSSPRNMEDAAKLFMSIIDFLGYGKYTAGRNGRETRIVWVEGAKEKITTLLSCPANQGVNQAAAEANINAQELAIAEQPKGNADVNNITNQPQAVAEQQAAVDKAQEITTGVNEEESAEPLLRQKINLKTSMIPNITISVDMSTWSEEKIKAFFKYAYGFFGEAE